MDGIYHEDWDANYMVVNQITLDNSGMIWVANPYAEALGNIFSEITHHSEVLATHSTFRWIDLGNFTIDHGFQLDSISAIMLVVVSLVSFLVHLYSIEYMKGDPHYTRYFGFLGLFTFSMNGIVLADNLIMMYVFWELVGLSSYLLIAIR